MSIYLTRSCNNHIIGFIALYDCQKLQKSNWLIFKISSSFSLDLGVAFPPHLINLTLASVWMLPLSLPVYSLGGNSRGEQPLTQPTA